jgi:hypothetical protein
VERCRALVERPGVHGNEAVEAQRSRAEWTGAGGREPNLPRFYERLGGRQLEPGGSKALMPEHSGGMNDGWGRAQCRAAGDALGAISSLADLKPEACGRLENGPRKECKL